MKKIVVLTGAGVSADSGIKTFRDEDGLWEGHEVTAVATPEGFTKDPELVLRFYNERRAQARTVHPNAGHLALVELEETFEVDIITQNIDNLHEQAGSSRVMHLHGELFKAQSVNNPALVIEIEGDILIGDTGEDGAQLRPHVVWFGEPVPMIEPAAHLCSQADICIIIGTSLVVYPAAGLIEYVPLSAPVYVVDPKTPQVYTGHKVHYLSERGAVGVPKLVQYLIQEYAD